MKPIEIHSAYLVLELQRLLMVHVSVVVVQISLKRRARALLRIARLFRRRVIESEKRVQF